MSRGTGTGSAARHPWQREAQALAQARAEVYGGWETALGQLTFMTSDTARCEEGGAKSSGSQSCSNEMGSTHPASASAPPAPESFVTWSSEAIQSGHLQSEVGSWPPPPLREDILTIRIVASGTTRPRLARAAAKNTIRQGRPLRRDARLESRTLRGKGGGNTGMQLKRLRTGDRRCVLTTGQSLLGFNHTPMSYTSSAAVPTRRASKE